jgi:hypothetical protein
MAGFGAVGGAAIPNPSGRGKGVLVTCSGGSGKQRKPLTALHETGSFGRDVVSGFRIAYSHIMREAALAETNHFDYMKLRIF